MESKKPRRMWRIKVSMPYKSGFIEGMFATKEAAQEYVNEMIPVHPQVNTWEVIRESQWEAGKRERRTVNHHS